MNKNTTPVPNRLFDEILTTLNSTELKILLVIIRQTLGWADKKSSNGRKEMDWLSSSQLKNKTGSSLRSISSAIESLVQKKLIHVMEYGGEYLATPGSRKGKSKLMFQLSSNAFISEKTVEKSGTSMCKTNQRSEEIAEHISKNVSRLAQKMLITKETKQN